MKKLVSVLLVIVMVLSCFGISVSAENSCGPNATYTISRNGCLVIKGTGAVSCEAFSNNNTIKNVVIKDGITEIEVNAFLNCTAIKSVYICETVNMIQHYAFEGCTNISDVIIANKDIKIGEGIFAGCTALSDVYFLGSQSEWDSIKYYKYPSGTEVSATNSNNAPLFNAALHVVNTSGKCGKYATYYLMNPSCLIIGGSGYTDKDIFRETGIKKLIVLDGITGIDERAFYHCADLASVSLPESLGSISEAAFRGCTDLTEITIPGSVYNFGKYSFEGCTGLKILNTDECVTSIPRKIYEYAFANCTSLEEADISTNIQYVYPHAFENCIKLEKLHAGRALYIVGKYAFNNCTALTDIFYYGSLKEWNNTTKFYEEDMTTEVDRSASFNDPLLSADVHCQLGIDHGVCGSKADWVLDENGVLTISGSGGLFNSYFDGKKSFRSVVIEKGITILSANCFKDTLLEDITLPDSLTDIYTNAFVDSKIKSITIPDSVKALGDYLFSGCIDLKTVNLGSGIKAIPRYCFSNCNNLESVNIPYGVTKIEECAFKGCSGLKGITIPDTVTYIGKNAFEGCTGLKSITIPDSVTSIGSYAFEGCTGLIGIPSLNALTAIPEGMFKNCTGLTGIIIRDNIETIGTYAFSGCKGLTEATFGKNCKIIGREAFSGCSGLKKITIECTMTEEIQTNAFSGCEGLKDVYYNGSKSDWRYIAGNDGFLQAVIHTKDGDMNYGDEVLLENVKIKLNSSAEIPYKHTAEVHLTITGTIPDGYEILWSTGERGSSTSIENVINDIYVSAYIVKKGTSTPVKDAEGKEYKATIELICHKDFINWLLGTLYSLFSFLGVKQPVDIIY